MTTKNTRTVMSFLFILISLTLVKCDIYNQKLANMYYINVRRTTKEKFKPTKQLNNYDLTDNNVKYFQENGYVMIGYDAIRYTYIGYQEAVNAGCWIGATTILYKHQYVGTASGTAVVPFYVPGDTYSVNSQTSGSVSAYGSATASAYGTSGYAYGSASSSGYGTYNSNTTTTVTAPGAFSYYTVPYSNDYYDQFAIYFVKKYYRLEVDEKLYPKPDFTGKEVNSIPKNSWFEVVAKGSSCTRIRYKGMVGYIPARFSMLN